MAKNKKFNWVVQHENDSDPIYVVEKNMDPDGDHAIEFSPYSMSVVHRQLAANHLAAYLNKMQISPVEE